mmetsp:Transcript_79755/g.247355  ORF Transcript_79755/g.247355 Transcript_79755/m.247355 type:complete len:332 (-) Transcript_79755:279-1274(-)
MRSSLPRANSDGGPSPKSLSSSSKASLLFQGAVGSLAPPASACLRASCAAPNLSSTACARLNSACEAMASYALRKPACPGESKGPGTNSRLLRVLCEAASSSDRVSSPSSTTMQERLSLDPASRAFRQTAAAASPGSGQARRRSATRDATSRFGKSPSEIPSHTSIKTSVGEQSRVQISGTADTGWSLVSGSPVCLYCPSPKARLTARSPFTRATPMTSSTRPPTRMMRSRSEGWSGLWSVVKPPSVPFPSTNDPSARPSSTRLSPMFPTRRWYLPPGSLGGVTQANVPVEPLLRPVARNSRSRRSARAATAASSCGAHPASSSSIRRFAT